jgi:hypothetical protein
MKISSDAASNNNKYYRKRIAFTTKQAPAFTMSDRDFRNDGGASNPTFLINMPSYMRMASPFLSLNDISYERIFVKFKNPKDVSLLKEFVRYTRD